MIGVLYKTLAWPTVTRSVSAWGGDPLAGTLDYCTQHSGQDRGGRDLPESCYQAVAQ